MNTLTIGQLAKRAGVNLETIRYYERRSLLPEPSRRASGYRQYPPTAVNRIRFIKRAQELGFSLNEIAELLSLRVDAQVACPEVQKLTKTKIVEIEQKLETLQRMHRILTNLLYDCQTQQLTGECPILATLDCEDSTP